MAVLTTEEKDKLRQEIANDSPSVPWEKPDINDALDALNNWWDTTAKALASAAIDAGTTFSFTNAQKKKIGRFWLRKRFFNADEI